MAALRSRTALLGLALVVTAHVTHTAGEPWPRAAHTEREAPFRGARGDGPQPGDAAEAFRVATLDGEFQYEPGGLRGALLVHAFTNKSAFLEALWGSDASVTCLLEALPDSAHVLFLSLDDSAATDALWMRERLQGATGSRQKEVLSRLHVSPVPVFALGNWIPRALYSWTCTGHNCGLPQAVFTSPGWKIPVIVKRLDARYDWLTARWLQRSYRVIDAGDGCEATPSVSGAVAWLSEDGCSFFTKVQNMVLSNASGVLVCARDGHPIQDMNCVGAECDTPLGIPAAMVHLEVSVAEALRLGQLIQVSFQNTPAPNFFIGIDQQGALAEMGWFLYPSFSFLNWQAQWFDFSADLQAKLESPAKVVSVFDKVVMQGDEGAVTSVHLPPGWPLVSDTLELDASLSCPGRWDSSCAQWDHTVQLTVCCDPAGPYCHTELGRWVTAFRRGIGHWLTDVSPLLPLLDSSNCTFTMKTVPWAMPWIVSLNLRFGVSNQTGDVGDKLRPFSVTSLYGGGTFDKNYNGRYQPIKFLAPPSTKKVELVAVVTGHGSDENGCGEFCVTSHHFFINGVFNNTRIFDTAGTALGCAGRVRDGAVPNEHGTWLYGRGGWCDGLQVDPWRVDVTKQLDLSGDTFNTVVYFGLFDGRDPNPSREPGYIIMSSFLVFYK